MKMLPLGDLIAFLVIACAAAGFLLFIDAIMKGAIR